MIHGRLHREDIARALYFDGFEPTPVGLGRAAHRLLGYTPSYWGGIRRNDEPRTRHPWPPAAPLVVTRQPPEQRTPRARRGRGRGRGGNSRASQDLQQQIAFADIPEIPTAIPILVRTDLEPSTSGRQISEEEEEQEEQQEEEEEEGNIPRTDVYSSPEQIIHLSDSSGYSPSPDQNMPLQPINLLDELNLGGRISRAAPPANPTIPSTSTLPPSLQQRDKRPLKSPQETQPPLQRRTEDSSSSRAMIDSHPLVQS